MGSAAGRMVTMVTTSVVPRGPSLQRSEGPVRGATRTDPMVVAHRHTIGENMRSIESVQSHPPANELIREVFAAFEARDVDRMLLLWDEHTHYLFVPLHLDLDGPADLRPFFQEMFTALPDLQHVVEEIHEVNESVAIGQWHLTGTFSGGRFQGIEPGGQRIGFRGIDVMRFEGGIVRRNDVYYDGLTFARQIGLVPSADSTADRGMLHAFNLVTKARRRLHRG